MSTSNFAFLKERWAVLAQLGALAEKNIYDDSNTTLVKLGMFIETIVKFMFAYDNLEEPYDSKLSNRINVLKKNDLLPADIVDILHVIRMKRNAAAHDGYQSEPDAKMLTKMAYTLGVWFMQTYGDWGFEPQDYSEPVPIQDDEQDTADILAAYEEENQKLKETLEALKHQSTAQGQTERKKQGQKAAAYIKLDEAQTREIIDQKLRDAGWEVDSGMLRYANGTRPQKGKNMAIAEWPTNSKKGNGGRADYALFCGLQLVGIVEAKRASKDVVADIEQSKDYARYIKAEHGEYIIKTWQGFSVPFLFATNGREYLKQIETKSGVWFLDARKSTNHPKALQGWYTPEGLKKLLAHDEEQANRQLREDGKDYLRSSTGLGLRDYQIRAIEKVEAALAEGKQAALVAMATGTGKTRTVVGLMYRLIKAKRFKRILFLVDRSALGIQACDTFKEVKIEGLDTFHEIYDIKGIDDIKPEPETKVHIATVQGMVRRILYNDDPANMPKVDDYDCIVVDEAHRGYILDREMGEVELEYRDQSEYISKYTRVLEYFDAVKIALTATPALHTKQLFGEPVFRYSYREAVIEGYLVDHEPPHQLVTKLKETGIRYAKGASLEVYDPGQGAIINIDDLPDELNFDIDSFNKKVINENFNQVVLQEIAKDINPEGPEKSLIFAATDTHADLVVKLLKDIYEAMGVELEDDAIEKITGSIKDPQEMIKRYKNETYPTIAVTVDLLSTGIDVPKICNLVFLRRVRSRILYEQMLGRATRLCPAINKTHFNIFDAVGLYDALEPITNMKPVVKNVSVDFTTLVKELAELDTEEQKLTALEQIIAKLQRKKRQLTSAQVEQFTLLSGGRTPDEFIEHIHISDLDGVIREFQDRPELVGFLDGKIAASSYVIISNHADELREHTRGYGNATKPADYIEGFTRFIKENMNKIPALEIVCTRPKALTRKALKELKLELDMHGYNEINLRTAWRSLKNEDIAADIISFIRRQALGSALIDHEQRIKNAVKKVKNLHQWTKIQESWLDRIEQQLLHESVLDRELFEIGAFKNQGGYGKVDKIFGGKLAEVIEEINENLYEAG